MPRSIRLTTTLVVVLLSASALAEEVSVSGDESPRAWLVELSSPPTIEGTSPAVIRAERAGFRAAARRAGIAFTERFEFGALWNGVSVVADPSQVEEIRQLPGVKAVWWVQTYRLPPRTVVLEPALFSALSMTGADVVQSEYGFTGEGVKVAIVDSGIDYLHPDLGGCFGEGCRVAFGHDFVGDAYDPASGDPALSIPQPDPDPMDCEGHGTHVAGIVGANGAVKGVAPGVTLGAYRVMGCAGRTHTDVVIAAMERALADGVQVLNVSLGGTFGWPQQPDAIAAKRLVNHGVVVVASFGNGGESGLYSATAPAVGEKVLGVASFENVQINGVRSFVVTPGGHRVMYAPGTAEPGCASPPPPPLAGSAELARTGTSTTPDDACDGSPTKPAAGSLAGRIALVRRGACPFTEKIRNAQDAGAAAVVLYNNDAGVLVPTVSTPEFTPSIPSVGIGGSDGVALDGLLQGGGVVLTWTADESIPNPGGNLISSFSSYGLAPDLSLKPDLGAPGGSIRSTYPLALGGYMIWSGTSMASPHVAGAAALYLEAHPRARPDAIRDALLNSASPRPWWGNPSLGFLDNVHRQGAGMLRIDAAIAATVRATPAKLSLGESEAGPATRTITLTNAGSSDVTFAVSAVPALATGPDTFDVVFWIADADVTFSATSVTVPAGGSAAVDATIAALPLPAGLYGLYGGYIVFTPTGVGRALRVPFAGFMGDYQAVPALGPARYGFPWLARLSGGRYVKQRDGAVFDFAAGDFPIVLVHLEHQTGTFQLEVYDAVTGRSWHRWLRWDFMARSSTRDEFFGVGWTGWTRTGKKRVAVPAGKYVLKLSVLKALGDETNPAHWETWTSPAFYITR